MNVNGGNNVAIGAQVLNKNEGSNNIGIGYRALMNATSSNYLLAIGNEALYSNTQGFDNLAIGQQALRNNISGSYNTAYGGFSLFRNTTALDNTALGFEALKFNTGSNNTAVGTAALFMNDAVGNTGPTGSNNTGIGWHAGQTNTGGEWGAIITGDNNTFLGSMTGFAFSGTGVLAIQRNNATAIGHDALVGCSNCVSIGNAQVVGVGIGTTTPFAKLSVTGNGTASGAAFQVANSSNAPKFTVLDNGNVSIGTKNPSKTFVVESLTGTTTVIFGSSTKPSCEQKYSTPSGNPVRVFYDDAGVQHSELGECQ